LQKKWKMMKNRVIDSRIENHQGQAHRFFHSSVALYHSAVDRNNERPSRSICQDASLKKTPEERRYCRLAHTLRRHFHRCYNGTRSRISWGSKYISTCRLFRQHSKLRHTCWRPFVALDTHFSLLYLQSLF
jgi:hypothetical protein